MESHFKLIQNDEILSNPTLPPLTMDGLSIAPKTGYIIINSGDRNWYLDNTRETAYNFRVVYGNNSFYSSTNQNLNILVNDTLTNVKSIMCQKIVIPNRKISNQYKSSDQPFILLNVDNIEQVSDASNNKLQNALAILSPNTAITYNDDIRYLEFININEQYKKINKTIPYMDIKIQRSDGITINNDGYQNDILSIEQIVYDTGNTILDVKTSTYFHEYDYKVGDIIKIRNYSFRESSLNYYETALFNDYINRSEGHIIQSISQSNSSLLMYDIIHILPVGENSKTTGNYELATWFDDLVTKTNIESNVTNDDSGKILNLSLQTTVFLKVEY